MRFISRIFEASRQQYNNGDNIKQKEKYKYPHLTNLVFFPHLVGEAEHEKFIVGGKKTTRPKWTWNIWRKTLYKHSRKSSLSYIWSKNDFWMWQLFKKMLVKML